MKRTIAIAIAVSVFALILRFFANVWFGSGDTAKAAETIGTSLISASVALIVFRTIFYLLSRGAAKQQNGLAQGSKVSFIAHRQDELPRSIELFRGRTGFEVEDLNSIGFMFAVTATSELLRLYSKGVDKPFFSAQWDQLGEPEMASISTSSGIRPAIGITTAFEDRKVVLEILAGSAAWNGIFYASRERTAQLLGQLKKARSVSH